MLEYSPVHIVYGKPFVAPCEVQRENVDVSADTKKVDENVHLNLRIDLSHLMMMNIFLNSVLIFIMVTSAKK